MKYIKTDEEYAIHYDKFTVEMCRDFLKLHIVDDTFESDTEEERLEKSVKNLCGNVGFEFYKTQLYAEKKNTIAEWKRDDEKRDNLIENAIWNYGDVKCLSCGGSMECEFKDLEESNSLDNARVMFFFTCSGHRKRLFYDNGKEYEVEEKKCIKCFSKTSSLSKREKQSITTIYTCNKCNNKETEVFNLSVGKEDPLFEEDRKKYCLSEKLGNAQMIGMTNLEHCSKIWKEKEKNKDIYEKIDKVEKVTILDLESRLSKPLEKSGFVRFHFRDPERSPNVELYVPFVVYDEKKDRASLQSSFALKGLLKRLLKDTNWRLMSDGVIYKVGMLEGRLRVYDTEQEMIKLVSVKK